MWHDPPPPGIESISLPGGAAKRLGLGWGMVAVKRVVVVVFGDGGGYWLRQERPRA